MIPRTLPPVHSPVSAAAIGHGWGALLGGQRDALGRARALLLERHASREVLLTDSGTTALALALRLAVAQRPDCPRVALPAWGCYDLATAADGADVGVVLYDLDPATLGPDAASLERALDAGVAAVVVVHFYGVPVNLPEIAGRAARAGALLIEDAAQAIGATLQGRPAGGFGDLGVLSFGRGKGWTGSGGGALLLNPGAPAALVLPPPAGLAPAAAGAGAMLKLMAQWLLARPACYALPSALPFLQLGQTVYHAPTPAARMSGTQAAVLLATAPLQESEAERRRVQAQRLQRAVEAAGAGRVPHGWAGGTPGWLRLPLLPSDTIRQRAVTRGARRLGIMPGYPIPLAGLPGFSARIRADSGACPGALELAQRLCTLPTHGQLSPADLNELEHWLSTV